jgi:hypothetical protein
MSSLPFSLAPAFLNVSPCYQKLPSDAAKNSKERRIATSARMYLQLLSPKDIGPELDILMTIVFNDGKNCKVLAWTWHTVIVPAVDLNLAHKFLQNFLMG